MGEFSQQQIQQYGFGFEALVMNYLACNPQIKMIGNNAYSIYQLNINLSLSAKQQIKELTISYTLYLANHNPGLALPRNYIQLSDANKNYLEEIQNNYIQVPGCNMLTFDYKKSFTNLIDLDYQNFKFTMMSQVSDQIVPVGVTYLTVQLNYQCPLNCSSCDSNGICQTCLSNSQIALNPQTNLNYCKIICQSGQYPSLPDQFTQLQECKSCISYCLSCNSNQDCLACQNGYEFIAEIVSCSLKCNSNQYRDAHFQCQNCMANCLECSGPKDCKICKSPYIFDPASFQCICPKNGYFLDSNGNCSQCDPSCQSCSGSLESNCTSCFSNWFSLGTYCYQWCPNNFKKQLSNFQCVQCEQFIIPDCQSCYQTCRSCLYNQYKTCKDCYGTRQINDGKCLCKNSADTRDLHFECSYDKVAVLQSNLDDKSPLLQINFGVNLYQIQNLSCNQIFKEPTLSDIGKTATCKIENTSIKVQLSDDSVIKENDEIQLKPGILSYQISPNAYIETFYLLKVSQSRDQNPYLDIQYEQVQNTCNDISFSVQANNDAQRGFFKLQWNIEVQPQLQASTQSQVDQIIQTANTQKSLTLIFPKYLLPPDSQITVQLSYTLKVNWQGTQKFTTNYVKIKQIVLSTIQSQYPPIFRFNSLSVLYQFYLQTCDQQGPHPFIEPLNISLQSQAMPSLNQNYPSFSDTQIQVDIQPFSIPISSTLDLNFKAILISDETRSAINILQIQPQLSNLFIKIQGGSTQLINYKYPLVLQGIAKDFELQDATAPQDINLTWSCQSIVENNGDYQCYNQKSQVFTIQQTGLSITIPGKTFQPYQTLIFTLKGTKDSRNSQSNVLISFQELDLPPLTVIFYNPLQLETVNLNEDIHVKLVYGANVSSDILTYAGAILYDDDVQGIIKFDFYEVKLRIWDYFQNIQTSNKIVQLRFTVYNPAYLMPSMTIINLNVNIPPNNCLLKVTPLNGQALITNFQIKMVGCSSNNLPITYQYFYYLNQDELTSEIKNPKVIKRRQIYDQTIMNEKFTFLPEGKITIMAQAIDSKLAIFNSTIQVQVSPLDCDEQTLLNMLDNALNFKNIQLTTSDIVLNLSVIGEQISKSNPLFSLSSVNQKKILIIEQLISKTNLLPKSSFLSTYSNKVISQLQSSLPDQSDTQVTNVLDQIKKELSKQPLSSQLANDNNIQLQNLIDSFKIIDSTTQKISYNMLPTQISISNSICNQLNDQTLPNQGGIQLAGNLINLDCQLITDKNLQQYMQVDSSPSQQQTNIYNAANLMFSQNPYKETPEFQQYTQMLHLTDPNLTISYNEVIQPNITFKSINGNKPLDTTNSQELNGIILLKFPNANISQSNSNVSCIQQQQTLWSTSGCQTLKKKSINGFYCYCEKQNPTTIIDDLTQLIENKNLQTAFSSQGLKNISNFSDFYKFAIFWILSTLTIIQIGLFLYGNFLDKKYQGGIKFYKASSRVLPKEGVINQDELQKQTYVSINQLLAPQQQQTNQQQIKNQQQQSQADEDTLKKACEQIQSNPQDSLKNLELDKDSVKLSDNKKNFKVIFRNLQQDEELQSKQSAKSDNLSKILDDILNNENDKQSKKSQKSKLDKKKIFSINTESNFNTNKETAVKIASNIFNEQQNQQNTQKNSVGVDQQIFTCEMKQQNQEKQEEEKKEEENDLIIQMYMSYPIMIRIQVFHDFFSIFYLYEKVLSRQIRFTLFYIRMIHCLSISTIFSQQYNEAQMIMVSILNSILLQVSLAIIKLSYKIKKIGKYVCIFSMITLSLFYFYVILSIVSGQDALSSNYRIASFFIMVAVDFLVVGAFISTLKMLITQHMLNKNKRSKIITKLYSLLNLQESIQNLSI